MRSSSRLGKVVGEGARLVGDDAPPAGVGTVRIGPYRVGTASCVFDMTDAAVAASFDDRLRDLRVGGSATAGNEPPTVFLVARRGGAPATHPWGVWRDGEPCETTVTEDYLMPYLLWEITRLLLERGAPIGLALTLATLLANGVTLLAGITIVKETMTNTVLANALDGVIAKLREGKGFGRPLAETGLYPKLATQMIMVGEESGRLEEMLGRVADVYDREVQVAIKRFLAVLEPALILGLAVLIGGIVFSILLGVMGMSELVG